jgi:predicted DNA-binding protein
MIIVDLGKNLEAEISRVAAASGKNEVDVIREAIERYLEEIEDSRLVSLSRKFDGRVRSISKLRKRLGLND